MAKSRQISKFYVGGEFKPQPVKQNCLVFGGSARTPLADREELLQPVNDHCDLQSLLQDVAQEHSLSGTTLQHIKALLSGIFDHARQQGYLDVANPVYMGSEFPKPVLRVRPTPTRWRR